ncbi:transposase [Enterococcus faecium]|nr:transposase [Enterococcus faecium]
MNDFTTEILKTLANKGDLNELFRVHLEKAVNTLLKTELTAFLDYEKYDRIGFNTGNSRNGSYDRTVKTEYGELHLQIPRDRNGEFKQQTVPAYIDQPKYSKACASLDDGFEDAFQYTVQGNSHNRLKSTNLIERLNQEVRRREKIIRIFPNQTSANRLIGAVLMDLHDEWIYSSRKYINFDK